MKPKNQPITTNENIILAILNELACTKQASPSQIAKIINRNPLSDGRSAKKSILLDTYTKLKNNKTLVYTEDTEQNLMSSLRMKKTRTLSGVTPVTVLTKPFPCPGQCIFCPSDVRMPKSYISTEPGAQRAAANKFDPYLQTFNRLVAFKKIGHPTDKIELIILGGTWTFYPENYQIWFVKRCFDALNDFNPNLKNIDYVSSRDLNLPYDESKLEIVSGSKRSKSYNHVVALAIKNIVKGKSESASWNELENAHKINERAKTKCIGLVIETRPDEISVEELRRIRRLGTTKVQLGIQTLNDKVLKMNKRGHDSETTRNAVNLIRSAGFKIHVHWMPNLYGSNPLKDIKDYKLLFSDKSIKPDEIKIYPCSLIETAELMNYYDSGLWKPYGYDELLKVISEAYKDTPRYCRISRVIRDIPSQEIVVGNKITNFRQNVDTYVKSIGIESKDIRNREIRDQKVNEKPLLKTTTYETVVSIEHFLELITKEDRIMGFLRLSLPKKGSNNVFSYESAMIREVHVYGQSLSIGTKETKVPQHIGLGKKLIKEAERISKVAGYNKISVISAVGTREYYIKLSFKMDGLYMSKNI